ncbi:condensation domain-containing protein, partial [Bacillus thuringiensis]|uniref:condensation domain-containing protein n=1 Tax=Bacillus thuringiensis TaxID=1428 RepID=UPI00211E54D2
SQELPDYMIPSYFVQLMQMPLTPNGKVDRKALPEPEGNLQTGIEYVAPRTRVEKQLIEIWKEVLFNEHIGIKHNFFDVGGHSLRATTLVSKIHKQMNINVTVRDVFQYQTVEQMAEFITSIKEETYLSIPMASRRTYYPVSSAQKRMYILSQLEGGELSYNMPGAMIVKGELDAGCVEEAFRNLIQRHESLRTSFEMIQGEPVQHIHPDVAFVIEKIKADKEEIETHIERFVRPFNLQEAPLLRIGLIEIRKNYHVLLFDIHHIISDGISTNLIIKEFIQLYKGELQPPLQIQYKDYAVWQQIEMQSERMRRQEAYWLNMFDGEIPTLELPIDYERPSVRSYEGDTVEFTIDKEISDGLKEIEKQTGATLYMVLLAAYTTLLAKYSGQEDIIVGTPIAGRTHADLEPIIGMFVNTLAIRNYPEGDKTFYMYVQEVKETMLNAYENQEYPFEELVQKVNIKRDMSRNPLFDTMLVLQNTEDTELQIEKLVFKPYIR